jgi:hypothetical protein
MNANTHYQLATFGAAEPCIGMSCSLQMGIMWNIPIMQEDSALLQGSGLAVQEIEMALEGGKAWRLALFVESSEGVMVHFAEVVPVLRVECWGMMHSCLGWLLVSEASVFGWLKLVVVVMAEMQSRHCRAAEQLVDWRHS